MLLGNGERCNAKESGRDRVPEVWRTWSRERIERISLFPSQEQAVLPRKDYSFSLNSRERSLSRCGGRFGRVTYADLQSVSHMKLSNDPLVDSGNWLESSNEPLADSGVVNNVDGGRSS